MSIISHNGQLRVNTGFGHWNYADSLQVWYVRDWKGSVRYTVHNNPATGTAVAAGHTFTYPSGLPVHVTGATTTDRLHQDKPWIEAEGIGWYDNAARIYDPITMRFLTPDPLVHSYTDFSPYTYCAGNPAIAWDFNGKEVYADAWCQQGIIDGLPPEEAQYVKFFENGLLMAGILNACLNPSLNMVALQTLANSNIKIIMKAQDSYETINGPTSFDENGRYGDTLLPGNYGDVTSLDNYVHIYTNPNNTLEKRATNIAHEAYGHVYFFLKDIQGLPNFDPLHRWESVKGESDGNGGTNQYFRRSNLLLES